MKPARISFPSGIIVAACCMTGTAWGQTAPAAPPPAAPAAAPPAPAPALAPPAEAAPPPPAADLPPPPPPKSTVPPPQGKMVVMVPEVPPARERAGYHVHDGFYLRVGVGVGLGIGSVTTDATASDDFAAGGAGVGLNCWIGGTPWRGVSIGGLISYNWLHDGHVEIDGDETDEPLDMGLGMLGVFIDTFPDAQRGLHLGASLGLAGFRAKGRSDAFHDDASDYNAGGLGFSGWIGYMGFVGPEWSLGGMLQVTGAYTGKEEDCQACGEAIERRGSVGVVSLSLTALYH